jgi:signal transduction histidine kinase
LRSPLSAIYSGILLLREMTPRYSSDDIVQDTFSAAERSCLRLIETVNSLLDISKVEAGRMKLEQQPTELREIVISVLDSLSPLAQEQDISLVGHVPEAWFVLVDEEKISRVLTNLVDNALKFTPSRGQVVVTTERATGETDMILCSVHDDGPGIPLEYRDKIFDRFAQGPSQSGKRRGTGLGLAFCKMMVEAHGGRIWVESVNDQGSTFYFTLPLALTQPADQLWIESPIGPVTH